MVVIGAGPAGAITAMQLSKAGLSVLVLDQFKDRPLGRTIETVSVGLGRALRAISIDERLRTVNGMTAAEFRSTWGTERLTHRGALLTPDGTACIVNRESFDQSIRVAACDAGAKLVCSAVSELVWQTDHWRIRGPEVTVHARAVVDATGRTAKFARMAGAKLVVVDKLIAHYLLLAVSLVDEIGLVEVGATSNGWLFACTGTTGHKLLAYFRDGSDRAKSPAKALSDAVDGSTVFAKYSNRVSGSSIITHSAALQMLDRAVGDGVIAVGDAAQTWDPLSSHGMSRAVEDAVSASEAILGVFKGQVEKLVDHEQTRRLRFITHLKRRRDYYQIEQRWPRSPFWAERHSNEALDIVGRYWCTASVS